MNNESNCNSVSDVVLSTRVRLARNLRKYPFPARLDRDEKKTVCSLIKDALDGENLDCIDMETLSPVEAVSLAEKHLISAEFASNGTGRSLLLSKNEDVSLMLCEEDHIRIQIIESGLSLEEAYRKADRIDSLIENRLTYAFDERIGYLTQCPTDLGTGMRASVLLHLPALSRKGAVRNLTATVAKLGLTLRGSHHQSFCWH